MTDVVLYKYRGVSEHTMPMLQRGTVWIALPSSFNDPFDCKPSILGDIKAAIEKSKGIRVATLMITLKRGLEDGTLPRKSTKKLLSEFRKAKTIDQGYLVYENWYNALPIKFPLLELNDVIDCIQVTLKKMGVLSLSERPDSLLMWAHYANNHQGFCLGFARKSESILGNENFCKAVRYVSDYPELDTENVNIKRSYQISDVGMNKASTRVELTESNLQNVVFSKSLEWEYEKEWRLIVPKGGVEHPYPGPLVEVIFGYRCNTNTRKQILTALKKYKESQEVRLREAYLKSDSFVIGLRDVNQSMFSV